MVVITDTVALGTLCILVKYEPERHYRSHLLKQIRQLLLHILIEDWMVLDGVGWTGGGGIGGGGGSGGGVGVAEGGWESLEMAGDDWEYRDSNSVLLVKN